MMTSHATNATVEKGNLRSVSEHMPSSLTAYRNNGNFKLKSKGKTSPTPQRLEYFDKHNNSNHQNGSSELFSSQHSSVSLSTHSTNTNTRLNRRGRQQRRFRMGDGASLHDGTSHHRIKVTRRTTNLLFFLLGMIPSLLLFFGHSMTMTTSSQGAGGTKNGGTSHIMEHHNFMKQQFQQDLTPKRNVRPDPFSPALLLPDDPAVQANGSNHTVLHFVKSRFMQYQPNLTALGWARLELFREFCLPSVTKQTTQNFVWLIYTDPDLAPELLNALVDLLAPYPHYYLIKSLSNAMWKGGQAQNMTNATIYTGNQAHLEAYMALRERLPILETRLDADDALHIEYLAHIQQQAIPMFTQENVQWMYWCVWQELEWNWVGPQGYSTDQKEYGIMESKPYEDFCPTPGLTLGYAAETPVDSIYTRRHSVLVERLHTKTEDFCGQGRPGKDCYQIIRDFEYPAFRCRTPTSASMVMTDFGKDYKLKKIHKNGYDKRWDSLRDSFGVPRSNVHHANNYMTKHILEIAEEALMGQCTKGHSCSVSCVESDCPLFDLRQNPHPKGLCVVCSLVQQQNARKKLETVIERYANLAAAEDNPAVLQKAAK